MTAARPKILVVDDEAALREVLSLRIAAWGYAVAVAADVAEADRAIAASPPDLVLSDVVLPDSSGIDLLRRLRRGDERLPVVMMTAHANVDAAVDAMKAGAADYLTKPLDYGALRALLDALAAELRRRGANRALDRALENGAAPGGLVGRSRGMRELCRLIELMATSDAAGIITGESGTGKEVVARAIHALSTRRDGPLVAVNAAAIPEGLIESEVFGHEQGAFTGATRARPGCFEQASGGTLFLDEIAEMPLSLQPKLLRVLEEGRARRLGGSREIRFDVRLLAATNRAPADAVRQGRLREDLYYRLNVFELVVPPLRERPDDVPLLTRHFVRSFNGKHGLGIEGVRDDAAALLAAYTWPGNVRELRNVIERAVIVAGAGWIESRHLPPYLQALEPGAPPTLRVPAGASMAEVEKALILNTLDRLGHNKAAAARQLGIDVKTIRNKLKSWEQQESA
jgi:two-component system, NtrC family, response regulator HydG